MPFTMKPPPSGESSAPGVAPLSQAALSSFPHNDRRCGTESGGAGSCDVAALPGRLDRSGVVMLSDEGDRLCGGHAIQHGKTGEGGARPAAPAATGDFHALVLGSAPRLAQRILRVVLVGVVARSRASEPTACPRACEPVAGRASSARSRGARHRAVVGAVPAPSRVDRTANAAPRSPSCPSSEPYPPASGGQPVRRPAARSPNGHRIPGSCPPVLRAGPAG